MRRFFVAAIAAGIIGSVALSFQAPTQAQRGQRGQQPAPAPAGTTAPGATPAAADPYLNNAAPGTSQFPLAAPAGKDSNSLNTGPPGAQNQGLFDPATWKYGTAFNAPAGSK